MAAAWSGMKLDSSKIFSPLYSVYVTGQNYIQVKSFQPWLIVNSLCLLALIIHELEAAHYLWRHIVVFSTLVFEYTCSVTAVLCLRWSRSQG